MDIPRFEYGHGADWPFWDDGDCYIIHGDAIAVLRTMPDSIAALVYADPPFNAGKEFRNKKKGNIGFSDIWKWDDEAEARLAELGAIADIETGHDPPNVQMLFDYIPMVRDSMRDPALASYLSWCTLLLLECRRVMGSTEYIKQPFVEVNYT